jgi:hypothetical protein
MEGFMKKTVVILIVLALLVPAFAMAQERGNTDNRIFGVQVGFLGGYDLSTDDTVVGRDFGLFFTLSEAMQVGFRSISGVIAPATDAMFFDLSYFLTPKISVDMMIGNAGALGTAGGIDAGYAILKSETSDVFSSTLKLKAGYIFEETNGIGEGVIIAGLVGSIGY